MSGPGRAPIRERQRRGRQGDLRHVVEAHGRLEIGPESSHRLSGRQELYGSDRECDQIDASPAHAGRLHDQIRSRQN